MSVKADTEIGAPKRVPRAISHRRVPNRKILPKWFAANTLSKRC